MEISPNKVWERKEWEEHVNDLLRIKHGPENYFPIPDTHSGDAGIEGYSFSGLAYQMYCPDELCTTEQLYEKQRDKITTDINKFITNKDNTLEKLLGETKIKRWILVVPNYKSKKLAIHAAKKTKEVITSAPSYVDTTDFHVMVWDRKTFKSEELELLEKGIHVLKLEQKAISQEEISSFHEEKPEFVKNIDKKLLKLKNKPNEVIANARNQLLVEVLCSQNLMTNLKEDYPEYYSKIMTAIVKRATKLPLECFDEAPKSPNQHIKMLHETLSDICQLHDENLECISAGTIAEWLMKCDLDYE